MKNKVIKNASVAILVLNLFSSVAPTMTQVAHADEDWHYVRKHEDCGEDKKKSSGALTTPSGVEGDWLTEGTEANTVAKKVFEVLTKEYGTSGEFAAGVMANMWGESKFIPDLGESKWDHSYAVRRFGMNEKKRKDGMGPSTSTQEANYGPDYFGGGLMQVTPYQKFTESESWGKVNSSEGWAVENQMHFLWNSEFGNRQVEAYFSRVGLSDYSNVEQLLSSNDAAKASQYFQMAYERPESFHSERAEWAVQANKVFNKDGVKADPSKWKFNSGGSSSSTSSNSSNKKKDGECKHDSGAKAGWGNDGTGSYTQAGVWKPEELPEELKKYAIDPESIGLHYGSGDGWSNPGDQCAHLSETMIATLWEKSGQSLGVIRTEAGADEADSHASAYGGKVTNQPTKGAVAGVPRGAQNSDVSYGHTYIVSHRFENGDILVLEQNFAKKSGASNSTSCTWDYRIVTKDEYNSTQTRFFSPESVGYTPVAKVKMKG